MANINRKIREIGPDLMVGLFLILVVLASAIQ